MQCVATFSFSPGPSAPFRPSSSTPEHPGRVQCGVQCREANFHWVSPSCKWWLPRFVNHLQKKKKKKKPLKKERNKKRGCHNHFSAPALVSSGPKHTHMRARPHTHALPLSHTLSHTHTRTHTLSLSHTHTLSHSLTHTYTHTHTHLSLIHI